MRALEPLRIVVIDDNPQMRTIVGTVLSAAGVGRVHHAGDGREGLAVVEAAKPDICFVDYEMPVMDGLDFIHGVRHLASDSRFMPIIMLTGHSDEPRLRAARDRGVNDFLCKPVSAHTILKRLEQAILRPRPFVETRSYFGPDRRRRALPDYSGPFRRQSDSPAVEI